MKSLLEEIAPQFIVDKAGKKTAVILDIATFQHLIDELEDFYLGVLAQAALNEDPDYAQGSVGQAMKPFHMNK
jgi:predicted DNA-binding protein